MKPSSIDIVIIGLAITSSWGNGHATTYRSLAKGLRDRGHRVLFLERDQPWYAEHRDRLHFDFCETQLYADLSSLRAQFTGRIRSADVVIVGSYVDCGREVCDWVLQEAQGLRAFYDIDTPVTIASLQDDSCSYLSVAQVPEFDFMLSFTGGPTLKHLEGTLGARCALPLYCSVDTELYAPQSVSKDIDLAYMGTYSADRQASLEQLLNEPARRLESKSFAVVGAQYPSELTWPANVRRISHLPPPDHPRFYSRQRCALNLTRAEMQRAGYSPSVRLFEAAACGTPLVSDEWPGLEEFFAPGEDITVARCTEDIVHLIDAISDSELQRMAQAARARVISSHSSASRALELERYIGAVTGQAARYARVGIVPQSESVA